MTTDLPAELKDRAAEAVDAHLQSLKHWLPPGDLPAVVDAVLEVVGDHLAAKQCDALCDDIERERDELLAERDELRAAVDSVLALCDERDQQTKTRNPGQGPYRAVSTEAVRRRLVTPDTEDQDR